MQGAKPAEEYNYDFGEPPARPEYDMNMLLEFTKLTMEPQSASGRNSAMSNSKASTSKQSQKSSSSAGFFSRKINQLWKRDQSQSAQTSGTSGTSSSNTSRITTFAKTPATTKNKNKNKNRNKNKRKGTRQSNTSSKSSLKGIFLGCFPIKSQDQPSTSSSSANRRFRGYNVFG